MAKKTLLNEAQIRRFMGLAGMQANIVSNVINEMYSEDEMDASDAEPAVASADPMMDPEQDAEGAEDPEAAAMDAEPMDGGELDLDPAEIQSAADGLRAAAAVMDKLEGAAGGESEDDMPVDDSEMVSDEPEGDFPDPAAAEEPVDPEADELSEVELQMSEEEIVQEVARRVAKRIIKAKRAQKALNEALGKK